MTSGGKRSPGHYDYHTLFTTRNDEEIEHAKKLLKESHFGFRRATFTRNSRPVIVTAIDKKAHKEAQLMPGRNGQVSQHCRVGMRFESANDAAMHIGLKNNEVAMYLSRSRNNEATLRGVTFAYEL